MQVAHGTRPAGVILRKTSGFATLACAVTHDDGVQALATRQIRDLPIQSETRVS